MKIPEAQNDPIPLPSEHKPIAEFISFLAIGTVIFWATDSLAAGAVMPTIRADWRSFRTGWWILRSDRRRSRSWICSAFCFATGFWQGAAAALASIGVFMAEYHLTGKEPDNDQGIATLQRLLVGVALTAFVGLVASTFAAAVRIRVWVHPMLREWARDDLFTIANLPVNNRFNHAVFVLVTSLTCPMLVPLYFLLIHPPSELFGAVDQGVSQMNAEVTRDLSHRISEAKALCPDMRFGQMLATLGLLAEDMFGRTLWDIEDDDLAAVVERFLADLSRCEATVA